LETGLTYLGIDKNDPKQYNSETGTRHVENKTVLIICSYADIYKDRYGYEFGAFVFLSLIADGPPPEDIATGRAEIDRKVYSDFVDHKDGNPNEKGRGYYADEYIKEYIGGPDSEGPCLYKTFVENKEYFDQLMNEDYSEYCTDGKIPFDTDFQQWPRSILLELIAMYTKSI